MESERPLRGTPEKLKLLIAISGCDLYDRSGFQTPMRETWLKDAVELGFDYKFFHGRGGNGGGDVVIVDCNDDYYDLTSKTKEKCKWAVRNDYDFVFCCFPDTYACAERLLHCGFHDYDYFGDLLFHANGDFCQGGQGYWLSKRAAEYVGHHPSNYPNEDAYVGDLMRANPEMKRGDTRFFFYAGVYTTGGPLKTNEVVTCHLSTYVDGGYKPEHMYLKHNLWLASHQKPVLNRADVASVLQEPIITLTAPAPATTSPRRIVRGQY